MIVEGIFCEGERVTAVDATAYINLFDLLLKLAKLPQDASKKEILAVIYDMPTTKLDIKTAYKMVWEEEMINLYKAWRGDREAVK